MENKKFQQPGVSNQAPLVPPPVDDVKQDVKSSDVKSAAPKKIAVIAIQEIPSFKGKRIPKGMEFEILPTQFSEKLMVKKADLKK